MTLKKFNTCLYFIISFFLFQTVSFRTFSQINDSIIPVKDSYKVLKKIRIYNNSQGFNIFEEKFTGNLAGFEYGFNTFFNTDYSKYKNEFMDNSLIMSNSVSIQLIQKSFGLQHNQNTFGLVTSAGIQFQNFRLDKNTTVHRLENNYIEPQTLFFEENQKSKFSVIWLIVPLLAEYQIPVGHYKNRFYFSGGAFGGYRINSHTKITYRIDHKREKLKVPDDFSLNDFRYGIMIRTGYRWFNVHASYDLQPFFKKTYGPELHAFSFGFTLIRF